MSSLVAPSGASDRAGIYLALFIAPLLWASNFAIGRAVHQTLPPLTLNTLRWLTALLVLLRALAPEQILVCVPGEYVLDAVPLRMRTQPLVHAVDRLAVPEHVLLAGDESDAHGEGVGARLLLLGELEEILAGVQRSIDAAAKVLFP